LTTADRRTGWGSIDPGVGAGLFEKYDIFNALNTNTQMVKSASSMKQKMQSNNYIANYNKAAAQA